MFGKSLQGFLLELPRKGIAMMQVVFVYFHFCNFRFFMLNIYSYTYGISLACLCV